MLQGPFLIGNDDQNVGLFGRILEEFRDGHVAIAATAAATTATCSRSGGGCDFGFGCCWEVSDGFNSVFAK